MAKRVRIEDRVEARTREIGEKLVSRLESRSPSIFHGRWWEDRLLKWACDDQAVRIQMLRFARVLPMLRDHNAIAQHLEDYYQDIREHLPLAARIGLDLTTGNSILSRALAYNSRTNAGRIARRFIGGETISEGLATARHLRRNGLAASFDLIGGSILSHSEADEYQQSLLRIIETGAEQVDHWTALALLDNNDVGPIPRLNLVIRLSRLDCRFRSIDHAGSARRVLARLKPILLAARQHHVCVHFEVEQHTDRALALEIVKTALMEKDLRTYADVGITIEADRKDSESVSKSLLSWVKKRGTPINVRLTEGDYTDAVTRLASYHNHVTPLFSSRAEVYDSYEQQSRFLCRNHDWLRPVFATQDIRRISNSLAWASEYKVPEGALEYQMPYGVLQEQAQLLSENGHRVRIQIPISSLVPGLSVMARHLLENPSYDTFLRQRISETTSVETLLMKPSDLTEEASAVDDETVAFTNEPTTDFSVEDNRNAMTEAIADARDEFGQTYPLVIDGKSSESRSTVSSRNPSRTKEIVGHVASASADQAADAVDGARRSFAQWATMETSNRCEYVELIAAEIRERRFELAAWICLEVGMTWEMADAEVGGAIDYCMFYAEEMRRLDVPRQTDVSGEENSYGYRPRGVCVAISPWNSPLAVLTGITAAAIVTGNTVVMKPAEQASVVAAKLMDVIRNAGVPDGVVNFLPGVGEDIGPELVASPDVDMVCFAGSQEVGLEINRIASETDHRQNSVRRVIVEMGGNNAVIVDADADLDEAVSGIIDSAYGFAGQMSSACSRVIVLESIHDDFVKRLIDAAQSLTVGAAEDPATDIGPVIDDDTRKEAARIVKSIDSEIGEEVALNADVAKPAKAGSFVGPIVLIGIEADSSLAQEEVLGPVLSVIKVRSLDDAFAAANSTRYALAGGIYSQSPATLKRARIEFQVGNLFLNRHLTGTKVQRQPVGGFRLSGTGTKSGGPDYLQNFLIPISVTENVARRGFAKKKQAKKASSKS